jgi:predicted HicB family RNase H-like nuclease
LSSPNHRSFTTRVPVDIYLELAERAQKDGICINVLVNQLLRLGMDKHISLDQALKQLVMGAVTA